MLELALALVGLVTAGIIALIGHAITSQTAIAVGLVTIALGLMVGLTTGFWYHVLLYRILSARMRLPGRWWVSPSRLHKHLTSGEWRRITPWYRLGGLGFVLCVAGGAAAIAGSLLGHR
jgi:hypothetical protein